MKWRSKGARLLRLELQRVYPTHEVFWDAYETRAIELVGIGKGKLSRGACKQRNGRWHSSRFDELVQEMEEMIWKAELLGYDR